MSSHEFLLIGDYGNVPFGFINRYNTNKIINEVPTHDKKHADNVVLLINNILECTYSFRFSISNKDELCLAYDEGNLPKYIYYKKIYIIIRSKSFIQILKDKFPYFNFQDEDFIILENEDWGSISSFIEKTKHIRPWYVKLWDAIPSWSSLN